MSEALERVIAQQQKEIDRLNSIRESSEKSWIRQYKNLESVFDAMGRFIDYNPRKAWRDDKKQEWNEYHKLKSDARMALVTAGVCSECWVLGCRGDCCE